MNSPAAPAAPGASVPVAPAGASALVAPAGASAPVAPAGASAHVAPAGASAPVAPVAPAGASAALLGFMNLRCTNSKFNDALNRYARAASDPAYIHDFSPALCALDEFRPLLTIIGIVQLDKYID